jgi:hypothetical protein
MPLNAAEIQPNALSSTAVNVSSGHINTLPRRPLGFTAIGVFFFFGFVMASLAGTTLVHSGTVLDKMWKLNPVAHEQLMPLAPTVGFAFLLLAWALLFAGIGWLKRRRWGWILGTAIIAINLCGDVFNASRGEWLKGSFGILVAGLLLYYMTRLRVRRYFT